MEGVIWRVTLMHMGCSKCKECSENAISHAKLTDGNNASSSYQMTQDNLPNITTHAAKVVRSYRPLIEI